ncbi:uncharacterized protein LOC119649966 [Hermetia illucens]|uniref:uncharacterized protein LOC119649966 n=1 Tax=Hermetia illucens TaxID=343691 RepID=UPI0018CC5F9E|nr:uncharacterized protein LOC119649966 [Hermetia illucens]
MVFIAMYPAVAALAMFIVLIIMILLRWGPKICKVRHHALPDDHEWDEKTYSQPISYA